MPNFINLSGQQFARLFVLRRKENGRHKQVRWLCKCACGVEKIVDGCALQQGNTRSCGCLAREHGGKLFQNLAGRRYVRLVILARKENNKHGNSRWLCKCDCGEEKIIGAAALTRGLTKSCGCLNRELAAKRIYQIAWKGGITAEQDRIRTSKEYKNWRAAVFKRDNFLCQECGDAGRLHAHHLKSFSTFPDLRFEISNGQTLCVPCHKKTDTFGGKALQKII